MNEFSWTLVVAAGTVGALHTAAPDHWVPFAALGRSRGWSHAHAARTMVLCGFGHVTVSAALGIAALLFGHGVVRSVGGRLAGLAPALLMAFGTAYMTWGLLRSFRRDPMSAIHPHDHLHAVGRYDHDHGLTEWSLFLLFCADPCVAVIPMILAAASAGWPAVGAVILAYELATIVTMVSLGSSAHAGARAVRAPWLDRYGDAAAGAVIAAVGIAVTVLGI